MLVTDRVLALQVFWPPTGEQDGISVIVNVLGAGAAGQDVGPQLAGEPGTVIVEAEHVF